MGTKIIYSLREMNTNEVGTIAKIPSLAEGASRTRFISSVFFSMTDRPSDR